MTDLTMKQEEVKDLFDELSETKSQVHRLLLALAEQKAKERGLRYQVQNFHEKYGYARPSTPAAVYDQDLVRFRLHLMVEEMLEVVEAALGENKQRPWSFIDVKKRLFDLIDTSPVEMDFVEFIDGLGDVDYTVEGTRISFGVNGWPIACEIQRANMSKDAAQLDASDASKVGGTKKAVKPEGWMPPDIRGELTKQGWTPPEDTGDGT